MSNLTRTIYGATFTGKPGGDFVKYYTGSIRTPVFENEDSSAQGNDDGGDDAGIKTDDSTSESDDGAGGNGNTPKSFTQEQLNKILSAEKKKHQKLVQKAVEEAQAASKRAQLTAKEREELDNRLELIQNEMRTKEEQAKRAAEKQRRAYEEEKKALAADRDQWKSMFTESTIQRSITDAAASNAAFSPKQIVAILGPQTTLIPKLSEDGNPTGELEPKVRYHTKDKEGKPMTIDLSPSEAVKRMKEEEEYLNLFRGEGSGGAGLRSQPGGKKTDVQQLAKDPAAYREARKKGQINFQ